MYQLSSFPTFLIFFSYISKDKMISINLNSTQVYYNPAMSHLLGLTKFANINCFLHCDWLYLTPIQISGAKESMWLFGHFFTYPCMLANEILFALNKQQNAGAFWHVTYLIRPQGEMPTNYHHLLFLSRLSLLPMFLKTHSARLLGSKHLLSAYGRQCTRCLSFALLPE